MFKFWQIKTFNMFNMENTWKNIIEYGRSVRNLSDIVPNIGKHSWECLSNELKLQLNGELNRELNLESNWEWTWNEHELSERYNYVHDVLNMKGDDDDLKDDKWAQKHFILQLVRIPKKNPISLVKIYQIAYNIGQYKATLQSESKCESRNIVYTHDIVDYFTTNKLDEIYTYIKRK